VIFVYRLSRKYCCLISIRGIVWIFSFYVRYSTLLHRPPLRFHCVGGCWDWTQNCGDMALTARRSNHSARSHPQIRKDLIHKLGYFSSPTRLDLIHHSARCHLFWVQIALSHRSLPFQGPKKSRFSGLTPANGPCNRFARIKIITYRTYKQHIYINS
jgi:hypothetical protein